MAVFDAHSRELLLHKYRQDHSFHADLITNNNLAELELREAEFTDVRIEGSYLTNAVLSGLQAENLTVRQSDLKGIDLSGSGQQAGCYSNSYLIKADFSASRLSGLRFELCTAHSIDFRQARIVNTVFMDCEMYKSKFDGSMLMKVSFHPGSRGDLAGLAKSSFYGAMLVDCSFRGINLNNLEITGAAFIHCDFSGALLEGIDFSSVHFIDCNFAGSSASPAGSSQSAPGSGLGLSHFM